jgi:thiamine pyrophosphate-dependent acetolactate synthase large subunit-like protein
MSGDANMYWRDELDKLGVRMLEVRHEGTGLGMADGWARATNTVGVCTATCGPGVTQLATALVTASRGGSPVVAFVGEHPTEDEEYVQRFDQSRFAAACEAGFVRVNSPNTADDAVRKAFHMARVESRPVLLSAPMNVQQMNFEDSDPYEPCPPSAAPALMLPNQAALEQAADIIASSKKVVIIAGRGAMWSGAGEAIVRLAERTGALITTSLMSANWLSEKEFHAGISGHYATRTAMQLHHEADCVIAIGASLNRYTIMGNLLYPNARFVQLDTKSSVMMTGCRFADCYLQTDAKGGAEALERLLAQRSVKLTGYRTPDVRQKLTRHFDDPAEFQIEDGCVDPRQVCLALDRLIPYEIGAIIGTGESSGFTNVLMSRPRSRVIAGKFFGCIGQGLLAAMGASVAIGDKPLVLIDGDASFMMHANEFETAVRYDIPLLVVVLNDQSLGSEYHKMKARNMNPDLYLVPTPDLGSVGRAFGGRGRLARTMDEFEAATREWLAKPGPMIIDARISRNALSLSARRLIYGRDE